MANSHPQRIVVVGSSNTDLVVRCQRAPAPGETVLGGEFFTAAGGKGANQAVAAARLGAEVWFVAKVGDDAFGQQALAGLQAEGVHCDFVTVDPRHPSGVALIVVEEQGQNRIVVAPGANDHLTPDDVQAAAGVIRDAGALLVQLETPLETVRHAVGLAAEHSVTVILNPAPGRPLPGELLRSVGLITPNESEAELLTGVRPQDDRTRREVAALLHKEGVGKVIITLGAEGAFVSEGSEANLIPGFPVKAVDTTAAGDAFNGALAVALVQGRELGEAVHYANAAAALAVQKLGAQPSLPTAGEVDSFLTQVRGRIV
ncbi:MAG: ribokinase [Calditrichaeota bacterium]|nr:ribokinase [Calditrichota bacterium]